ncbi:MAG: hypothetical protein GKS05_04215 [Nitrospirales bacterium]|nr:hypothetical protein [Nitrospirales bacterium]
MREALKPLIVTLLITFLIWSLTLLSLGESLHAEDVLGSDLSFRLINPHDHSSVPLDATKIKLTSQTVTLKKGENIQTLLEKRLRIEADGESIGLLYSLNPGLDEKTLLSNSELVVPKIEGGEQLSKSLEEGKLVRLTTDHQLKKEFWRRVKTLEGFKQNLSKVGIEKFESSEDRERVFLSVNNFRQSVGLVKKVMERRIRPLNKKAILQFNAEIAMLNRILRDAITEQRRITSEQADAIYMLAEETKGRIAGLMEEKGDGGMYLPFPPSLMWKCGR